MPHPSLFSIEGWVGTEPSLVSHFASFLYQISSGASRRAKIETAMLPDSRQFDAALRIMGELRAAGHEAYFAGGCVRDLLLGREPKDFDVATSATPDVVLGLFPRTFAVGAHFGVVLVADRDDKGYGTTEVATFRSDGAYSDGRHPNVVRYTTSAEEDVQRRDFTINGLLMDRPLWFLRA